MMWEQGRNLIFLAMGTSCVSFEYNDQGIRTSKTTSSGTTYNYILDGTRIVAETWSDELLIYLYDDNGSPIGMQSRYSGYAENEFDTYWFEKNLQGDIIAVYNENGTKLVEYTYDAWGNFTTTYCNGGENDYALDFNPFRYRGYYYDEETGFYYLNSRYYDPVTGRFINADSILDQSSLIGNNMYAYCANNPIMHIDTTGQMWELIPALHPSNHVFANMDFGGSSGGGSFYIPPRLSPSYYDSSAYNTWATRSRVAGYDANWGNYYYGGGSSYGNIGYYVVSGSVTVTDSNVSSNKLYYTKEELRYFGEKGKNSGFRTIKGSSQEAMAFVRAQTNGLSEYATGKYVGYNSEGVEFRIYNQPKCGYTSIRINGIEGLKGIKFIWT